MTEAERKLGRALGPVGEICWSLRNGELQLDPWNPKPRPWFVLRLEGRQAILVPRTTRTHEPDGVASEALGRCLTSRGCWLPREVRDRPLPLPEHGAEAIVQHWCQETLPTEERTALSGWTHPWRLT